MITVRELLALIGKSEVDIDGPVRISTSIFGIHEATTSWIGADGRLHLSDESKGPITHEEVEQACQARGLELVRIYRRTKGSVKLLFADGPARYWTVESHENGVEDALDRWVEEHK